VFGEDLNYPTVLTPRGNIPLEVTGGDIKNGVQLIGDEFVRRENAECLWIPGRCQSIQIVIEVKTSPVDHLSEELSYCFHATLL
jgi:hypothetical protein